MPSVQGINFLSDISAAPKAEQSGPSFVIPNAKMSLSDIDVPF